MHDFELMGAEGIHQTIHVRGHPTRQPLLKIDETTSIDLPSIENVNAEGYVELS